MKTYLSLLLCLASFSTWAQKFVAPVESRPPPAPPVAAPTVPAIAPIPHIAPIPAIPALPVIPSLSAIAQVVDASQAAALAQVKEAVDQAKTVTALTQAEAVLDLASQGGKFSVNRGARPGRTLVVPGKNLDASSTSALEEDLNVMARILEKAVERKSGDDNPKAMGIDLFSVGSSSGIRNLYLDGYGALFILKARFPLVPLPEKTEQDQTNEPASTTWVDTRRELYGPKTEWSIDFGKGFHKAFGSPAEDYDADKVEKLKSAILEALKNASNIRHLKPDEKVTVAVTSGVGGIDVVSRRVASEHGGARAGAYAVERHEAARKGEAVAQSVLTIHVKKSDIDSFAKGKLTLDEFRRKATVVLN